MTVFWDERIALANPHKGWYHHFPDNHINKYIIRADSHLLDFPGMDHIYIRLAWSYLEPEEGKFSWVTIDTIINKWTQKGLKIALRISCKETSTDRIEQQFATPKWVMEAGAKGNYYLMGELVGPDGPWEPVYDDPIFLQKLENFLQKFADRYDGRPWLRYVDIGSFGDWGEGHTWAGSRIAYSMEQKKTHIDLYCRYFQKTQLIISDDFVYDVKNPADRETLHRYVLEKGISYRDDSPLVNGYFSGYSQTYTVRSPEFFQDVYRQRPTVFELEHYRAVKRQGNWHAEAGSAISQYAPGKTGADFFRGALELLHASYIGYHGDALEWLTDNPELTVELLNRCGYWYFLHRIKAPDSLVIGQTDTLQMIWENRGVAPAYHAYVLKIRLDGPQRLDFELNSGNQKWMPAATDGFYHEKYLIAVPKEAPPGSYHLKFKLFSYDENKDVGLALKKDLLDKEKYYDVTLISLVNARSK
ncbi:MAG: beta-galactosidase [candidate division KSB1 bacterium]|nr:beta-galactosidase [candidate division KSB1 bacterium]MDZ7345308.1 beta-galactosidase [candidate division KSB1 bacterium]